MASAGRGGAAKAKEESNARELLLTDIGDIERTHAELHAKYAEFEVALKNMYTKMDACRSILGKHKKAVTDVKNEIARSSQFSDDEKDGYV